MPGNQTCRFESVRSPLGDWLTQTFPSPHPNKNKHPYMKSSQQQWAPSDGSDVAEDDHHF